MPDGCQHSLMLCLLFGFLAQSPLLFDPLKCLAVEVSDFLVEPATDPSDSALTLFFESLALLA